MYVFNNPCELSSPFTENIGESGTNEGDKGGPRDKKFGKVQTDPISLLFPCCLSAQAFKEEEEQYQQPAAAIPRQWRKSSLKHEGSPLQCNISQGSYSSSLCSSTLFVSSSCTHNNYEEWCRREVEQVIHRYGGGGGSSTHRDVKRTCAEKGINRTRKTAKMHEDAEGLGKASDVMGKKEESCPTHSAHQKTSSRRAMPPLVSPHHYRGLYSTSNHHHQSSSSPEDHMFFLGSHDLHGVYFFIDPVVFRVWMPLSCSADAYPDQGHQKVLHSEEIKSSGNGEDDEQKEDDVGLLSASWRQSSAHDFITVSFRLYTTGNGSSNGGVRMGSGTTAMMNMMPLTPPVEHRVIAREEQEEVVQGGRKALLVVLREPVVFPIAVADLPGDTVVHCTITCYEMDGEKLGADSGSDDDGEKEEEEDPLVMSPSAVSSSTSSLLSYTSSPPSTELGMDGGEKVRTSSSAPRPVLHSWVIDNAEAVTPCHCMREEEGAGFCFRPPPSFPTMAWHTTFHLFEPHSGRRVVGSCSFPFQFFTHQRKKKGMGKRPGSTFTSSSYGGGGSSHKWKREEGSSNFYGQREKQNADDGKEKSHQGAKSEASHAAAHHCPPREFVWHSSSSSWFSSFSRERIVLDEDKDLLRRRWEGRLVPSSIPWLDGLVETHLQRCRAEEDVKEEEFHQREEEKSGEKEEKTNNICASPESCERSKSKRKKEGLKKHTRKKGEGGGGCLWIFLPVPTVPFPIFYIEEWTRHIAEYVGHSSLAACRSSFPLYSPPPVSGTKAMKEREKEAYAWYCQHVPHVEVVAVPQKREISTEKSDVDADGKSLKPSNRSGGRGGESLCKYQYYFRNYRGVGDDAWTGEALLGTNGGVTAYGKNKRHRANPTEIYGNYFRPYADYGGKWLRVGDGEGYPSAAGLSGGRPEGSSSSPIIRVSSSSLPFPASAPCDGDRGEERSSLLVGLNMYESQAAALSAASIYLFLGDTTAVPGPRERQRLSQLLSLMPVYPLPITTTITSVGRHPRTTIVCNGYTRVEEHSSPGVLAVPTTSTGTGLHNSANRPNPSPISSSSPPLSSPYCVWMRPDDVALLWRYRYYISRDGQYFLLFLSSVVWSRSMTAAEVLAAMTPAPPTPIAANERKNPTNLISSFSAPPIPSSAQRAAERMLSAWSNVVSLRDIFSCLSCAFQGVSVIRLFAIDALCRSPVAAGSAPLRGDEIMRQSSKRESGRDGSESRGKGQEIHANSRIREQDRQGYPRARATASSTNGGVKGSSITRKLLCLYALPLLHCTRHDSWDGRELSRFLLATCCGGGTDYHFPCAICESGVDGFTQKEFHPRSVGSVEMEDEGCWPLCAALYWGSKVEGALEQKNRKGWIKSDVDNVEPTSDTKDLKNATATKKKNKAQDVTDPSRGAAAFAPSLSPPPPPPSGAIVDVRGPFTWLHESLRYGLYHHAPSFLLLLEQQENFVMRLEMLVGLLSSTGKNRTEKIKKGKTWLQGEHSSSVEGGFSPLFFPTNNHSHKFSFSSILPHERRKAVLQEKILALRRERRRRIHQKIFHPKLFYKGAPLKEIEEDEVDEGHRQAKREERRSPDHSSDSRSRSPSHSTNATTTTTNNSRRRSGSAGKKSWRRSSVTPTAATTSTTAPPPCSSSSSPQHRDINVVVTSPSHPDHVLVNVLPDDFYVFKSSKQPIRVSFVLEGRQKDVKCRPPSVLRSPRSPSPLELMDSPSSAPPPQVLTLMFKTNDDTRQDAVVISLLRIMDHLLHQQGLDLSLTPYRIQATSPTSGLIEVVPGVSTLESVKHDIPGYWRMHLPSDHKGSVSPPPSSFSSLPSGAAAAAVVAAGEGRGRSIRAIKSTSSSALRSSVWKAIKERYIKSLAGYSVITYLLGVGDRHLENILVASDGRLLHIDFGFLFGRDPKPFAPPMKLCKEMIAVIGGEGSAAFQRFQTYCCRAYNILRQQAPLLLYVLSSFSDAECMPQVSSPALSSRGVSSPVFLAATVTDGSRGATSTTTTTTPATITTLLVHDDEGVEMEGLEECIVVHSSVKVAASVEMMRERLRLDLTNAQATQFMLKVISDSIGSRLGQLIDLFHSATQATKD